jgi:leucine dehydrogenase
MDLFATVEALGHEQVVICHDPGADYRAIIAIHSTALGPAVGGTRLRRYASEDEALFDALRLSRGMTYKNAAAGLPLGGGKAVILGDGARQDRERLFRTHSRFVERLGGRFITGQDLGTSTADMEYMTRAHKGEDPSPWTARGVLRAMQSAAKQRWGSDELAGKTVALQGCGNVGLELARLLHAAGARLVAADADPLRLEEVARELGAAPVELAAIYDARADIFAPCAVGAVLDEQTIPRLRVEIVAGAANNQLRDEDRHGRLLEERGILYAPDFVANSGGIIWAAVDLLGWEPRRAAERIDGIYDTMLSLFAAAQRDRVPPQVAANRLAESRLRDGAVATELSGKGG